MQALFIVNDVLSRIAADGAITSQIVRLNPVYENNPDHPNYAFWKATPTGSMEMTINNPLAFGSLVSGKKYLLTFEPFES